MISYLPFKRFCDLLLSFFFLLLIWPLFLIIGVILSYTGEREIFYRQSRIGYRNQPFFILKFATMLKDSPNIGSGNITIRNDPRVTVVGRYLRITKLNEVPQLLNVFKGEMSFVGPRPLPKSSFVKYTKLVRDHIYSNRPGITGIGSLVFRDEESLISFVHELGLDTLEYYKNYIYPYKGKIELWYMDNQSFSVDFKILLATFLKILMPQSKLEFTFFKDLPEIPQSLTKPGILELANARG